jgi:hypothetical protein|tara:strand:+ start:80 stop:781 length:702 start_codon:yes stop_codon:yes gene_type:complete
MYTLSDEGIKLFLNGMCIDKRTSKGLRSFVWNLFHSDYDERLQEVVQQSWHSDRAMAAEFNSENFEKRLVAAVTHVVKLLISKENGKTKRKHVKKNIRFFIDVMKQTFEQQNYQTAHLILLAITHPIIRRMDPKMQSYAPELIKNMKLQFGAPLYKKHIQFWRSVRTDTPLPSLFAFNQFIQMATWQRNHDDVQEARDMVGIFQYLEHGRCSPIYNQKKITTFQLQQMAARII